MIFEFFKEPKPFSRSIFLFIEIYVFVKKKGIDQLREFFEKHKFSFSFTYFKWIFKIKTI